MTTSKEETKSGTIHFADGNEVVLEPGSCVLVIHENGGLDSYSPKWENEPGTPEDYLPPQVQALFFAIMLLTQGQFAMIFDQLESMTKGFYKHYKAKEVKSAIH